MPVSLVGTFGVHVSCGYSLDNLSLMALTISTGFVVDDAIVVIENITRHLEEGMTPVAGRTAGREGNRFHGRLDQHLAGGGFHSDSDDGRHRRPALPRIRRDSVRGDRGFPGGFADHDADDVRRTARARTTRRTMAGSTEPASVSSIGCCDATKRSLRWVLRHQPLMLAGDAADHGRDHLSVRHHPQGIFPAAGYRAHQWLDSGPTRTSPFSRCAPHDPDGQHRVAKIPAVAAVMAFNGGGFGGSALNTGSMFMTLKPLAERRIYRRSGHRPVAPQAWRAFPVSRCTCSRCRTCASADAPANAQYQYTLQSDNVQDLHRLGAAHAGKTANRSAACSTSTATSKTRGCRRDWSSTATPRRGSASPPDDRQHALRRLRSAPGLDHVHAAQSVPRGARGRPAILAKPRWTEIHLRPNAWRQLRSR